MLLSHRPTLARNHNVSLLLTEAQAICRHMSHLDGPCDRKAMPHLAKVLFQNWSTCWNKESPRQLDIGGCTDFGYPSNLHVMIPKQLRCWKAGDTWGKWLWKIRIVFQPCKHTVARSAYWTTFNFTSFSGWPTDYPISDQIFCFPTFLY